MASSGNENAKSQTMKAIIVTLKQNGGAILSEVGGSQELVGKTLVLELVSNDLNPKVNSEKGATIKGYNVQKTKETENNEVIYEALFEVPPEFGEVGAVLVENEQEEELFLKSIVIDGSNNNNNNGSLNFTCDSWIQPKNDMGSKRVFFSNKSYLPSETPEGLKKLREEELVALRGNGEGERNSSDRIYDYDVYNDLGDPDTNIQLKRPVLGGSKQYPYPRRCRTGRTHSEKDPLSEKRSGSFYVPRDEKFSEIKQKQFTASTFSSGLSTLLRSDAICSDDPNVGFSSFEDIDSLYKGGYKLPIPDLIKDLLNGVKQLFSESARNNVDKFLNSLQNALHFDAPEPMKSNKFFWLSDEEFARETLAGVNPYSIQLIKDWPLRSKLDPQVYGPPESAITNEVIESQINETVEQAIIEKKLFMLDYHDLLLPYVSKVREIEGTTLYGSRTIFYLTSKGTLKPLAIELTRPQMNNNNGGKLQWKSVYTPSSSCSSTELWLWRLAKAHVLAHDSGFHELVSHWLRTHASVEPYVIATNRQLSAMHPIYRLLHPHLRYTLGINALARQALISAGNIGALARQGGIIELSFSPKKYSMELSSRAYDQLWRFDLQALPNDLIHRGMAVEDPKAPHGLKLTIEDYPFANDGLLIWDSLKQWITDYVSHYYPNQSTIQSDQELQSWWNEIKTIGHGDKSSDPWWPNLNTQNDLIHILTTISWVSSAHHASVNFAQYIYGGYFPNRPTIARKKMPNEDPSLQEWQNFMKNPGRTLIECFPSKIQATLVMLTLNLLSNHSPDEEYIGQYMEPSWGEDPIVKSSFERFSERLKEIEGIIDSRNGNTDLKNRHGAGLVPYELLKPFSGPGVTGKGVPYSISI